MGDELFEKYRTVGQGFPDVFGDSQYRPIVLAAIMMEFGATIKEAHVKHLRDVVSKMQCNEHATMVLNDMGMRGAGKRQFLAALDHYQAGKPRSLVEPCCHYCGKVDADIKPGKTLMRCGGCKNEIAAAWFCDKVCMAGRTLLLSTMNITDIVVVLSGLSESPVEAPQTQLRGPSWERTRHVPSTRQEFFWCQYV